MIALTNPLALLGLLILPPAYLLYVRMRREPVPVPSILIWKRAGRDGAGGRPARRRTDLRLLFYLAAILAGVLALSRPVIRYQAVTVPPPGNATSIDGTVPAPEDEAPRVIHVCGVRDRRLERALGAIPRTKVRNVWGGLPESGPAVLLAADCDSLPKGDVAVINPRERAGPITIEGKRSVDRLVIEDPGHPLLEGVDVKRMGVREVLVGSFPQDLKVIVSAGGMPVVAVMPNRGGRLLYLGFDMSGSEWHAYPSFPIFWYNFFALGNHRPGDESGLPSEPGVSAGGTRAELPAPRMEERNLSPVFLVLMLASIAGLWLHSPEDPYKRDDQPLG